MKARGEKFMLGLTCYLMTNKILTFSEVEAKEVSRFAGVYSVRSGK